MTTAERRQRRSNDPVEALFYQLDASRERADLTAVILADEQGLCIASAGAPELCEEVAAHGAIIGSRVPRFDGALFSADGHWDVHVLRFAVDGTNLFMCAMGGSKKDRAREAVQAMDGTTRILGAFA